MFISVLSIILFVVFWFLVGGFSFLAMKKADLTLRKLDKLELSRRGGFWLQDRGFLDRLYVIILGLFSLYGGIVALIESKNPEKLTGKRSRMARRLIMPIRY